MIETIAVRLRARLGSLIEGLADLIQGIPIKKTERNLGVLYYAGGADYYFDEVSTEKRAAQVSLKRKYDQFAEVMKAILGQGPEDLLRQWKEADDTLREWIELGTIHSLTPDGAKNASTLRSDGAALGRVFDVLDASGDNGVILVPDTNSLIDQPDPMEYRVVAGCDDFTFVLLPTVLGELDELKRSHRAQDVRDKTNKAITRYKGWRAQAKKRGGTLLDGVTVNGTITVKAQHGEPDMGATLSWLDPDVPDDRIVAAVLALETEHPAARVILVTGDINLQNKADAALIETAENP